MSRQRATHTLANMVISPAFLGVRGMGTCYIAGPMTGISGFNYVAFDSARDALNAEGWEVINPADLDRANLGIDFSAMEGTEDLSEYVHAFARQDITALLMVDRVFLLNGWEASTGAMNEARIATMLGLPVTDLANRADVTIDVRFSGKRKLTVNGFTPQTVCDTPGVFGSSPACVTCTATCSPDPADVDPAELAYWKAHSNA
jgi:hypothetical protein